MENKVKMTYEMDYAEFVRWSEEYVMTEFLDNGLKGMKRAISMVVHQTTKNEVFNNKKK